ncbi:MAG: diguanylate cyclase [Spirochaetes bacterium]|nr:diguanylate cyclase [Spirochaetota bacterium]
MANDAMTILAVDDNATFLDALVAMIPKEYRVITAGCVADAIDAADGRTVDIAFLDIVLPDGEGFDLCRKIRCGYASRPIQLILMSGMFDQTTLENAITAGADDFIKKPFDDLELGLRLKAAMIRLENQKRLFEEREFYRKAVRQEENLSSQLLDEYMTLKATLHTVSEIRRSLEETNRKLEKIARYDSLSGLLNRASLFDRIEFEIQKASSEEIPLVGLMLDIDKFKSINDSYGHLVGDCVIREIGLRLRNHLRKNDFAGRYGGEEFFMIFPDSTLEQCLLIAERIRAGLADEPVRFERGKLDITASIGVAQYRYGDTVTGLINRADLSMYKAKQLGRNRIETGD